MHLQHFRFELGLMLEVTQDAVHLSRMRWRQEPAAPDAPLAVRLAAFQGAMMAEVERAFRGLDPVPVECLAMLILKGVVETGEDMGVVEAASGVMLR